MTEIKDIQTDLLNFVCRNFLVEADEVNLDESLVDQGIIDSFGLVEIATHMRKKYGISTEESEMNRENFGSLFKMASYIQEKLNG